MTNALFISHAGERCGVYQYGRNLFHVLKATRQIEWIYRECGTFVELTDFVEVIRPDVILFNYQGSTLPWLCGEELRSLRVPTAGVFHRIKPAARGPGERGTL